MRTDLEVRSPKICAQRGYGDVESVYEYTGTVPRTHPISLRHCLGADKASVGRVV